MVEEEMATDAKRLIGVWRVLGVDYDFYHQFNEDGTLRAARSPDLFADSPLFTGEFWFDDGQLYINETEVNDITPRGDEPGIYDAHILASGRLRLTKIEDACEARVDATQREHERVR